MDNRMLPTPALPIRVVLADDHELVRSGIRALLEDAGIDVAGEARDGEELLAAVQHWRPDVVMTDIDMPRLDGIQAIARLRAVDPACRVLVLSMHDEVELLRSAVASGAQGYLLKDAPAYELEAAVRSVAAGGRYFASELAVRLLTPGEPAPEERLTERQLQVLAAIARGESTKEIAFSLGLSPKTVDVHRARLMERLGITDVAGLTRYAIRMRLVSA
jgi:DNA-binding NarL/FixJ family response regulator